MRNFFIFSLSLFTFVFAACGAAVEPPRKPNMVFIVADQLRAASLGCMGNKEVITPNIDKIASEGLVVTNGISCQPVCTPFRGQLLTGKYGHTTGIFKNDKRLPDSEVVISQHLKQQGYTTGYIGKWHLAGHRNDPVDATNRRGWDYWAVHNCSHDYNPAKYWLNNAKLPTVVQGWEPEVQAGLAAEFIKKNKANPFCLILSFGPPHNPYVPPQKYLDKYRGKTLTPRPNVPGAKTTNLLQYYALITGIDECLGRIDSALAEAGVSGDTLVVITADHGDMLGSQGQSLKQRPWEEAINIPCVMRYPAGIRAGQKRDCIVSSVDFMPTLLGFAGAPIPAGVQGMDLSALLRGESTVERQAAFLFNVNGGNGPGTDWRGIRTKEWVYAYHALGEWVMYDLKNDPYELKNLINDPAYAAKKQELKTQLQAMRADLGETMALKGVQPPPIRLP